MSLSRTKFKTVSIEGVSIFYREAGSKDAPTLLLLHGFPSSSFMYRDLITALADTFHVVAPDYPGFGGSDAPEVDRFEYTFDHFATLMEGFVEALNLKRYVLYMQDYGAPVGFRLATRHPSAVAGMIIQNGNIYEEGLTPFWGMLHAWWASPNAETEAPIRSILGRETMLHQYTAGCRDPSNVSPDAFIINQAGLERPGNIAIQMALFFDYRTNPALNATWQDYLRRHQPPMLVVWGRNDPILRPEGALAYRQDVPKAEVHLLDTGHHALEEDGDVIAEHILRFFGATESVRPG